MVGYFYFENFYLRSIQSFSGFQIHFLLAILTFPKKMVIASKFLIEFVAQPISRNGQLEPSGISPVSIAVMILKWILSC